jgi:NAD(P)-dependent dehydrogenase (short-subunit alcohol dehydrogenase family)
MTAATPPADRFLTGRTALVTGSSRNLGAAIARRLSAAGARIAVNYRSDATAAEEVVAGLEPAPDGAHVAVRADLASAAGVGALVEEAAARLGGRIDVLVNNAGPFAMTPFPELPEPEWDAIWDVNVKAAYLASRAVAPGMRAAGWGRIVMMSAGSAYLRNHSIYGLAKDALRFLAEELAVELAPEVTVNAVAPGQIAESAADIGELDPTFVERAIAATPAGRLVSRAEVAAVVALLCRPELAMVTGVTVPVDGGWRLPRF